MGSNIPPDVVRKMRRIQTRLAAGIFRPAAPGIAPARPMKFAQPSRCIFCGGTPLTGEHIWPDWVRKYLKRDLKSYAMLKAVLHHSYADSKSNTVGGDIHHRRVRCVCECCNNGWMRELENLFEPLFAKMLTGGDLRVTESDQATIAGWFALKAIVTEFDHDGHRVSTRHERQYLRRFQRPPPEGWRMFVGYYPHRSAAATWINSLVPVVEKIKPRTSVARMTSQSLTFVIGPLLLLLLRSSMPGLVSRLTFGLTGHKLRPIWPLSGVSFRWPPDAVTDDEARRIAYSFQNYTMRLIRRKLAGY